MVRRKQELFEERKQRIIDGALKVFGRKGYELTTNKDIAEAAGINSPGLIYHYFKDKGDLFRQVITSRMPLLQMVAKPEELMDLPIREVMLRIGRAYLTICNSKESVLFMRLIFSEVGRSDELAALMSDIGPNTVLRFMVPYLEHKMEIGEIRRMDPEILARCLFSPFLIFLITREVLRQPAMREMDTEQYLQCAVDIYLNGIIA